MSKVKAGAEGQQVICARSGVAISTSVTVLTVMSIANSFVRLSKIIRILKAQFIQYYKIYVLYNINGIHKIFAAGVGLRCSVQKNDRDSGYEVVAPTFAFGGGFPMPRRVNRDDFACFMAQCDLLDLAIGGLTLITM